MTRREARRCDLSYLLARSRCDGLQYASRAADGQSCTEDSPGSGAGHYCQHAVFGDAALGGWTRRMNTRPEIPDRLPTSQGDVPEHGCQKQKQQDLGSLAKVRLNSCCVTYELQAIR